MKAVLDVKNLFASYESLPVLEDITFSAKEGDIIGILGPNGGGKSTLLKSITDTIPRIRGEIRILGQPYKKALTRVAYMPQRESVDWDFPINVYDVVMMGRYPKLGLFKGPGKNDHKIVKQCLKDVGMTDLADRQISKLSGGQQQRVFLARALAQCADIYLMDEPFAGVDAKTEKSIVEIFHKLKTDGKILLVVHHDLGSASDYFENILLLNRRMFAFGRAKEVLTVEKLEAAYEGRLHFLDIEGGGKCIL